MAAIITDTFRRNNAKLFIGDIANRFNTDELGHYDSLTPHRNKYYLGIGRSDKWDANEESLNFTIPSPLGSFSDNIEVFNNLATLVLLGPTNTSIVIPNIRWSAGSIYRAYDSYDSSCFYSAQGGILPCYVTVPDDGIYMCVKSPGTATAAGSTPLDATSEYKPIATADGYVWVLIQKFTGFAVEFITDQFVEVRRTALEDTALSDCRTNSGGLVTGFKIVSNGTYASTPTVWLRGTDGLSYGGVTSVTQHSFTLGSKTFATNIVASASAFDAGQTVKIISTGNPAYWLLGTITSFAGTQLIVNVTSFAPGATGQPSLWDFEIQNVPNTGGTKDTSYALQLSVTMANGGIASVSLPSGSFPTFVSPLTSFPKGFLATSVEIRNGNPTVPAQIIPIMSPFNGFGYNPSDILPAWYAGVSVSLNGNITEDGDTSADNFYTPYRQISIIKNTNASSQITVNALRSLTLTGSIPTVDVNANVVITDTNGLPLAIADYTETVGGVKKIYFHQNSTTGYREMPAPTSTDQAAFKIAGVTYNYNAINQSELSKITTDIHGNQLIFNGYPYYGEVVFVENRKKVVRALNQNEKIKIIIQF